MNPHTPKWIPILGVGVPMDFWMFRGRLQGSKLIYLCVGGVPHIFGKLSNRAKNLLQTSCQLEVCRRNYGPPKSLETQFWEFWDSNLGVSKQNGIWVLAPWPSTKTIIRKKLVAFPRSRPWWVLWVHVYSWFVCAPKVL
jgi:hypothetical protein